MRWKGNRQSDNVEDRRGSGDAGSGGGGGGLRLGGGSLGVGTVVAVLLGSWLLGVNPMTVLSMLSGEPVSTEQAAPATAGVRPPADDEMATFVSTVLADTEDVWTALFRASGQTYQAPRLVLFSGATATACGRGQSAMGPFYCPGDSQVYIDLAFYDTLKRQLGAPGDFAQAYVIAHEVGHHVQHLMGITDRVDAQRARSTEVQANAMSVRVELQADCFAGVWAHHAQAQRQLLETGDLDEALNAAARIGDDALQGAAQGRVVPDSFTHGSSAQRSSWFRKGYDNGRVADCDTFSARTL